MHLFVNICKKIKCKLFNIFKIHSVKEKYSSGIYTNRKKTCYNIKNVVVNGGVNMNSADIIKKADEVRKKYNLASLPIDITAITNSEDINVEIRDLTYLEERASRKISGLIMIDKEQNNKLILINSNDSPARRNFTLAHELGHYFLHAENNPDKVLISFRGLNNQIEREANSFAAALLMPAEKVEEEYNSAFIPTKDYLADIFKVSPAAMEVRLSELGLSCIG